MRIGPHLIDPKVILAPMAGVTDKPFRLLCKRLGAGLAVSEMTISDPRFWGTSKSRTRMDHVGEPDPVSVQIRSRSRAGIYPGAQPIYVAMVGDRTSGRLLGAQMTGTDQVAHRINAVAVALLAKMSVAEADSLCKAEGQKEKNVK